MNYFQQYETERKHLKVSKMWICVDPSAIGQSLETLDEIVEIIEIRQFEIYHDIRYRVLNGRFKSKEYSCNRSLFIKGYKPYTGAAPSEDEEN